MTQEIEEFANNYGEQIKKGFLSSLILLVLDKEACHGYKIVKEIIELSHGIWKPNHSTVYPCLKEFTKKKFVKIKGMEKKDGRTRKIYEITQEGKKALKKLVIKQQNMISELRSLIFSIYGYDGNYSLEDLKIILPNDPIFGWKDGKSDEEKIENLNYYKGVIKETIIFYKNILQDLEKELTN